MGNRGFIGFWATALDKAIKDASKGKLPAILGMEAMKPMNCEAYLATGKKESAKFRDLDEQILASVASANTIRRSLFFVII